MYIIEQDPACACIKKGNMIAAFLLCNIGRGTSRWYLIISTLALFINVFTQYISTAFRGLNIAQKCYRSLNDEDSVLLKLFVYYSV